KAAGGIVWLGRVEPPWATFIPTSDGRRLLEGVTVADRAQLAGRTLVLEAAGGTTNTLYVFGGPDGRLLGEHKKRPDDLFHLSGDGRWLARQTAARQVNAVRTTGDSAVP